MYMYEYKFSAQGFIIELKCNPCACIQYQIFVPKGLYNYTYTMNNVQLLLCINK